LKEYFAVSRTARRSTISLAISFGCSGSRHRSLLVASASPLARHAKESHRGVKKA